MKAQRYAHMLLIIYKLGYHKNSDDNQLVHQYSYDYTGIHTGLHYYPIYDTQRAPFITK